jgi:ABC-type phosphate transport system substrate-binding protein
MCPGASISVSAIATFNGLNAVNSESADTTSAEAAAIPATRPTSQIAMSDGPAPKGYPALVGHPVAVVVFAVVANKDADVYNLTLPQLRGIFSGAITNWRQVGGADLPVRIVARAPGSGTRATFDAKVLGHAEPAFSSYDCSSKDAVPASPVIKCEVADTGTLLQRVNSVPGAIGYAQVADAAAYANVESVKLGGSDPDIGSVQEGAYPFWTVEYLYTYGAPAAGSLTQKFLTYMGSFAARDLVRQEGYTPCVDSTNNLMSTLCAPGAR